MGRQTIIIAATPTSNGDLHLGHMAGPYLAGDVYARYLRATGQPVIYTTCTDDSQTYVVTTARRRGVAPAALCQSSTVEIKRSLEAMGISVLGLPPIDEKYRATVLDFFTALHAAGRFRERVVRLPFARDAGTCLYDGLIAGICPVCFAGSSGGVCEACGHPNNFDDLLEPYSTANPHDPVVYREHTILVLALEEYRDRLTAYYAQREGRWRPHAMQLVREILARPLPEVPVTMPGSWGIAAPFAQTPGQVLYPWVEAMPASIYSTWWSAAQLGAAQLGADPPGADPPGADPPGTDPPGTDALWRREQDAELVYFHGFDNVYHWGLMDLVLLMAHDGRYVVPENNVTNEFYDLEDEKFSTSRNHLIWSTDLLAEVPRDLVRFYLALTAPEHQRTNFSKDRLRGITTRRLVTPWNRLADALSLVLVGADTTAPLPTTAAGRRRSEAMLARFRLCYALSTFSLTRAAETVASQLDRLRTLAEGWRAGHDEPGDLLLGVRTLLSCAAPILIDAADKARESGVQLDLDGDPPLAIAAFRLHPLPSAGRPSADLLAPVLASQRMEGVS